MLSKFSFVLIFLALTVFHISVNLKPSVEASVNIKPISLPLSRKLNISVGYEYQHTMLWVALMNSMLVVYGLWRCQREVDKAIQTKTIYDANTNLSEAAKVKLDWQNRMPSSWQLFPMRSFVWFTVPWLTTFLLNAASNYTQLNLVLGHFCASPLEVLGLYLRVQTLFMQRLLASIAVPSWLHFNGAFESIFQTHSSSITYENNLLTANA